ncbi:MAG: response regulator [Planctomycetaceae bacterium]|nr:response regulator [Planctomycetaceae bacterium]
MPTSVLVAERNVILLDAMVAQLSMAGYVVHKAQSGLECLGKLRESWPDAAVIDHQLPWGGGDGVAAWLQEEAFSPVAVVMLVDGSLDLEPGDTNRLWLRKPFHGKTLISAVEAAVRSTRRRPAGVGF